MNIKNKGKLAIFLGAAAALAVSLMKDRKDYDNMNAEEEESKE
ncbi:hypothetical protein SAMN04487886_11175 [Clostridium sp. DSM 8431]|nr:hypothetical protein [Clostridium sp. DSM 8431]SFU71792.1 hypothetical protein SAMN04487886_11175 [Clostridium sp. DSM 8431]